MTIELAIERVWEKVIHGEAEDTTDAVEQLWDTFQFSEADRLYLAKFGLSEKAKLEQRAKRYHRQPAIGVLTAKGESWDAYLASLTSVYDNAEGHPQPLIEFTAEDWTAFSERMRQMSHSYKERAELGRTASVLLHSHKANTTKDLPRDVLVKLAERADEVLFGE